MNPNLRALGPLFQVALYGVRTDNAANSLEFEGLRLYVDANLQFRALGPDPDNNNNIIGVVWVGSLFFQM